MSFNTVGSVDTCLDLPQPAAVIGSVVFGSSHGFSHAGPSPSSGGGDGDDQTKKRAQGKVVCT